MSRWFRLYGDVINDPKVLSLSEAMRWTWVAVLCAASKNDGKLPANDHLALMLRVTKQRAAAIIATLHAAGLIDKTEIGFAPHNWDSRQYKSDVSTERVKRFRNGKRNVSETPPEAETESEDKIGSARARNFTEGSKVLATSFWKALGFESPLQIPPEFAGVDWRAIRWDQAGWTADLIEAEIRKVGTNKPLNYYEKVFATAFAKRQAPLPVVEIREAEKLTVTNHGTAKNQHGGGSILATIDRELAKIQREENADFAAPAHHVLRIPN
jgi:hypothetical protein